MNDEFEKRRYWFELYCKRTDEGVKAEPCDGLIYTCPCCGYPTLEERGGYEICYLCNWEDDGQDDPHADEVWGGPNRDYSLTDARKNFKRRLVMYDPDADPRIGGEDSQKVREAKQNIIDAFRTLQNDISKSKKAEKVILTNRKNLREDRSRRIRDYEVRKRSSDTPEAIKALVEEEIAGDWSMTNAHGVDLRKSLVDPIRQEYLSWDRHRVDLWLVIEEDPIKRNRYKIVFDSRNGKFGLATSSVSDEKDIFLGYYGSFIQTFKAM